MRDDLSLQGFCSDNITTLMNLGVEHRQLALYFILNYPLSLLYVEMEST